MLRGQFPARRLAVAVLAPALLLSAAAGANAQASPPPPASPPEAAAVPWYQQVAFNGSISVSYNGNLNSPPSHTNQFRVFDSDSASIQLDLAQLIVQRDVSKPGQVGFRTELIAGAVANVTAAAGLFRDESGEAGEFDVMQAFMSYLAPAGRGLRFDVGKFTTHIGYEVVEGYDGYNDIHSHSLLFGYAEPVTHTGVRLSYPFGERLSAQLLVVNGWDNVKDNNTGKSLGAQIELTATPRLSLVAAYMGGPEQDDNNANTRRTFDAYAVGKASDGLTISLNYAYGTEELVELAETAGGGRRDARWQGVAGYGRYDFSKRFATTLRAEWFDDPQGARTGYPQSMTEVTLAPEFRPRPTFVLRGELRRDRSSQAVFERSDGTYGTSQVTLAVNALVVF
jgi:hypothetical protein